MAFSFEIEKPTNLNAVLTETAQKIRNKGGSFHGNEHSGNFSGSGVTGSYLVGSRIKIDITKKPILAKESYIKTKITGYFDRDQI